MIAITGLDRFGVVARDLLEGLKPGQKIRFTIDEDQRAIVRVAPRRD